MSKSRVFDRFGRVIAPDSKFTGEEPVWDDGVEKDVMKFMKRRSAMLNFYNYYLSPKELKPSVIEWMKKNGYTKDQIKHVKSLPDTVPNLAISKLCRALNRGMISRHPDAKKYFEAMPGISCDDYDDKTLVRAAIDKALRMNGIPSLEVMVVKPKEEVVVLSPMERLQNKVDSCINSEIDKAIDEFVPSPEEKVESSLNLFALLKSEQIPANGLKFVKDKVEFYLKELVDARDGTCDQCVEGYSYLTKPAIKHRIKIFEKMLNDIEKYRQTSTQKKAPRKKKSPSADKMVLRLKYQRESSDYSVSSISPVSLVGANRAVIFNTKNRWLVVLNSDTGLTISGSTFKNINEDTSYRMTLRKPEDYLTNLLKTKTITAFDKIIDSIKSKKASVNGRINESCVLLKSF